MFTFNHCNLNITDPERSLAFYREALGLEVVREKESGDHSFKLFFLGDGQTDFRLELTWLRDHPQPYNLGENESHLCLTAEDFDAAHAHHAAMGCICYENPSMGVYVIHDPDDYWIEIVPKK